MPADMDLLSCLFCGSSISFLYKFALFSLQFCFERNKPKIIQKLLGRRKIWSMPTFVFRLVAYKAVLNIASQITDTVSNYGMFTFFFLSSWKTTWETEFIYKISKLRVCLWQASTFFRLEASVSEESILETLKLRLPFNSPLRNPAKQILCNHCSYFLLCCIIYITF